MLQSDNINELVTALAKAQAMLSAPQKNRVVKVKSKKTGVEFSYSYMTLDELIEHVRKPLADNGLWFVQAVANVEGRYTLHTRLVHSSGQWMGGETPILVESKDPQEFGGAITYMRRYSLAAILGVAADDDSDGDTKDQGRQVKQEKPAKLSPEDEAKAWIQRQKDVVGGLPDRHAYQEWRAHPKTKEGIEKLQKNHAGLHETFTAWLDDWYSNKG